MEVGCLEYPGASTGTKGRPQRERPLPEGAQAPQRTRDGRGATPRRRIPSESALQGRPSDQQREGGGNRWPPPFSRARSARHWRGAWNPAAAPEQAGRAQAKAETAGPHAGGQAPRRQGRGAPKPPKMENHRTHRKHWIVTQPTTYANVDYPQTPSPRKATR